MKNSLYNVFPRQATWLELFFDLVFVAVIGVITHDLAHTHDKHIGLEQILRFPLVFIPVWWIWATHTIFSNRFDKDDRHHRFSTLAIMGLVVAMSTFIDGALGEEFAGFVLCYFAIRAILAYMYIAVRTDDAEKKSFAKGMGAVILVGAAISTLGIFFEGPLKFAFFYGGLAFDLVVQTILRRCLKAFPIDRKHLVERIGLMAIILLGESVISIVNSLSYVGWDIHSIISAICGFVIIWSIWWIYFDSFEKLERAKRIKNASILIYGHLVLCISFVLIANMIRHTILGDLDHHSFSILSITGVICFYIGKQAQYIYAFPPFRKWIYINSSVCVALTATSTLLPRIEYSLIMIMIAILYYVYANFKWTLKQDASAYLEEESKD